MTKKIQSQSDVTVTRDTTSVRLVGKESITALLNRAVNALEYTIKIDSTKKSEVYK